MKKENIRIILKIGSPILIPKYPIHLDALLYAALEANTDWMSDKILYYIDTILDKENGIYKASSMRYLSNPLNPITATENSFPTRTHWEEWEYSDHEKKKTVIVKGGPYRKRITKYKAISVGYVDFYAVGDEEKISYLIDILGFIGLGNNQGFGEILDIVVEKINNDYSFWDEDGELARNIPVNMVDKKSIDNIKVQNSVKPPYYESERVLSYLPNFRIKNI